MLLSMTLLAIGFILVSVISRGNALDALQEQFVNAAPTSVIKSNYLYNKEQNKCRESSLCNKMCENGNETMPPGAYAIQTINGDMKLELVHVAYETRLPKWRDREKYVLEQLYNHKYALEESKKQSDCIYDYVQLFVSVLVLVLSTLFKPLLDDIGTLITVLYSLREADAVSNVLLDCPPTHFNGYGNYHKQGFQDKSKVYSSHKPNTHCFNQSCFNPLGNNSVTQRQTVTQIILNKPCSVLNSMGRPFCQIFTLDRKHATVQLDNSEVKMTVSENDLSSEEITVYASSFRNVSENYRKLNFSIHGNELIASPAVEYYLSVTKLNSFARIEIPYVGSFDDIHCWKVDSDQGISDTPNKLKILCREKVDIRDPNLITYYEKGSCETIVIFTKQCSWFICTTCNSQHVSFGLKALIFGSLRTMPNGNQRVSIALYIADEIRTFEDYYKLIEDTEKRNKRELLQDRPVNLPTRVSLTDCITVELTTMNDPANYWKHMADSRTSEPLHNIQQEIKLDRITKCHFHVSSGLPYAKDWYLEARNNEKGVPFECIIKLKCAHRAVGHDDEVVQTNFVIDAFSEETENVHSDRKHNQQPQSPMVAEHPSDALCQPDSANLNRMPRYQPVCSNNENHFNGACQPRSVLENVRGEMEHSA